MVVGTTPDRVVSPVDLVGVGGSVRVRTGPGSRAGLLKSDLSCIREIKLQDYGQARPFTGRF